jgi:hypothetical protein
VDAGGRYSVSLPKLPASVQEIAEFVGPILHKTCSKCGESKGLEGFYKGSCKYARASYCKLCQKDNAIKYEEKVKKIKTNRAKWCANNKEKYKSYTAKWRKENPEKIASWRKNNKEKIRDYNKKWREKNPDKYIDYQAKAREELKDSYILDLLKGGGEKNIDIPQELIELKRIQLQIKREIRKQKNGNTNSN